MDLRAFLSDIDSAIINRWGSLNQCPCMSEIYSLAEAIKQITPQIKDFKKEKQKLSKAFRNTNLPPSSLSDLKGEMQVLSSKLKQLESNKKKHEAVLRELFHKKDAQPDFPIRFTDETADHIDEKVTIQVISDDFSPIWNEYISIHTQGSIYHHYDWRHLIKKNFNHEGIYLAATDENGRCRGVLPLIMLKSRLFGSFSVSIPYFNYGGPLADSKDIEKQLLAFSAVKCQEKSMQNLEIRATKVINDWPKRAEKVSMILSLPDSQALLDEQLGSKLRAQINQAKNHSLEVKAGASDLLNDFYSVFAENMRDLGTPVYAKGFFKDILDKFPDQTIVTVIYRNKKPIATAFLIGHREMLEIPWASTLRSYNKMNANMLLYRTVLGQGIDSGYRYFDFGRSSKDANTFRFKKQWGAKPQQHHWHYWLGEGESLPELNPNNPKFTLAIKLWQKIPVAITRFLGPHIVKNLP